MNCPAWYISQFFIVAFILAIVYHDADSIHHYNTLATTLLISVKPAQSLCQTTGEKDNEPIMSVRSMCGTIIFVPVFRIVVCVSFGSQQIQQFVTLLVILFSVQITAKYFFLGRDILHKSTVYSQAIGITKKRNINKNKCSAMGVQDN